MAVVAVGAGVGSACSVAFDVGDYASEASAPGDAGAPTDAGAGGDGTPDGNPAGAYRELVLADAPLAYFRFEETEGSVAKDETGRHDGVYRGVVLGVPGAIANDPGRAAQFPPSGGAVVLGDVLDIVGAAPFSFEAWAKPVLVDETPRRILTKRTDAPDTLEGWSFYQSTKFGLALEAYSGGAFVGASTGSVLPSGAFHHVVLTYDGATIRFYVDGKQTKEQLQATSFVDNGADLTIGAFSSAQGNFWQGDLDEIAIYDRALSPARVAAHHARGSR